MTVHLNDKRLAALLEGKLSASAESELAQHLASDCSDCEKFLLGLDDVGQAQLLAVLGKAAEPGDLSPAARCEVIEKSTSASTRLFPKLVPLAGFAFLLLIGLGLVLAYVISTEDPNGVRTKGAGGDQIAQVEISLGVVDKAADGTISVTRVSAAASISSSRTLVLRATTQIPCFLYIIRIGSHDVEMLIPAPGGKPFFHPGGAYTPKSGNKPAGIRLADYSGRQHFVAVCAPKPLSLPADLQTLVQDLQNSREPAIRTDLITYDVFTISVVAEEDTP
ncbi:MAG: hypothetical protein JRJ87_05720 [Deltaproteobacteria bacterium]|nr:hypothetical protein [Deltaproteobacteria bacterium]